MPDYMIPFVPIIKQGEKPFAMFRDLKQKYGDWILDVLEYNSADNLYQGARRGSRPACARDESATDCQEGHRDPNSPRQRIYSSRSGVTVNLSSLAGKLGNRLLITRHGSRSMPKESKEGADYGSGANFIKCMFSSGERLVDSSG
jgi:hypothetical protein